jgi:hypothetical protein
MRHVDIVVISWARNEDLFVTTCQGLTTLFSSDEGGVIFHAYVVESNPRVFYEDVIDSERHSCKTIHPNSEFGYHKFLNLGRKECNSPYVALCNSDLTYEKGWAERIIEVMDRENDILSASPWCPQTQGDNMGKPTYVEGFRIRQEIAGWCIFQSRKIYEFIGDLDENFKFWYCDNDYSFTLKDKNVRHCLVTNSIVNHHHNIIGKTATSLTDEEIQEMTTQQLQVFVEKWG